MCYIIKKFNEVGNNNVVLCECGISFGYNNFVVDMFGMDDMKFMVLVIFDVMYVL